MHHEFLGRLSRALYRPKGVALIFSAAMYVIAVILLLPPDQYRLVVVLTIGIAAPLGITILHSLALTRWNARLQQAIDNSTSELRPLAGSFAKLDAYSHAADLNVGRIAALQHSLEGRFDGLGAEVRELKKLEGRLDELAAEVREHKNLEGRLDELATEVREHKQLEGRLDELATEVREHKQLEGRLDELATEVREHKQLEGRLDELATEVREHKHLKGRLDELAAEVREHKNLEGRLDELATEVRNRDAGIVELERNTRRALEELSCKIAGLHAQSSTSAHRSDIQLRTKDVKQVPSPIRIGCKIGLPLVSIVITNRNYEKYLLAAISSCLTQGYPNLEIIVVDDSSTDKSIELAEQALAGHSNSRVIRRLINGGHGSSMCEGLRECSGDYVIFLDADDLLFPDFVGTHLYVHLALPWQVAFTSSDQVHIGPTSRVLTGTSGNIRNTFLSKSIDGEVKLSALRITPVIDKALNRFGAKIKRCVHLPSNLAGYHWGATSSLFFKRTALEEILIEEILREVRISGDFYFTLSHLINGSAVIDSKLGAYRIHPHNNFSGEVHLDGVDASHLMPRTIFTDTLGAFVRHITSNELERFASLLGPNWLYPELLAGLQKYAALVNKTPGLDTRLCALAILDNFDGFTQVIGREFALHLLNTKLGVSIEELQQRKLL